MTRTCPSCGTTSDDHARFCNRCGYPFPAVHPDNMTRVQRRDEPLYEEPVSAHRTTPPPRAPAAQPPERKKTGGRPLPFKKFLIGNRLTIIYILGAVAIIAISLLGIIAGFQATGTGSVVKSFSNTTALVVTPTASPLFWLGFLIFASLIWRMFCEIAAIVYRMYEPATSGGDTPSYDETPEDVAGPEEMYECPHCGKTVPADQLRECEHCGVQGCSHCIRMMGLVKKTMTCKDCFEKK